MFESRYRSVCGDAKNAVAVHSTGTACILAARCVRIDAYTNHSHLVIQPAISNGFELDNLVADDFVKACVVVAIVRCDRFPHTALRSLDQ